MYIAGQHNFNLTTLNVCFPCTTYSYIFLLRCVSNIFKYNTAIKSITFRYAVTFDQPCLIGIYIAILIN